MGGRDIVQQIDTALHHMVSGACQNYSLSTELGLSLEIVMCGLKLK